MMRFKLLLLGGTSHVGKSTLGQKLAKELGWDCLSTDQLARHPGRPWRVGDRNVPDHVIEHYSNLTVPELVQSVMAHYRHNVWPIVDAIVRSRLNNTFEPGLVFEGSAIVPGAVAAARYTGVAAVWLTAPDAFITERIKLSSQYEARRPMERRLIDAFLERSIAINQIVKESVQSNNQRLLDTSPEDVLEMLRSLV